MWAGDDTPSDEMFVDGEDSYLNSNRESNATSNTLMQDLVVNNKLVHQDFFNDFPQDLFDDDDLTWSRDHSGQSASVAEQKNRILRNMNVKRRVSRRQLRRRQFIMKTDGVKLVWN